MLCILMWYYALNILVYIGTGMISFQCFDWLIVMLLRNV